MNSVHQIVDEPRGWLKRRAQSCSRRLIDARTEVMKNNTEREFKRGY
jgi:hypothetical protein